MFKTGKEARDYIQHETKRDVLDKQIELTKQGQIKVDTHRSEVVDHVKTANQMISLINATPMPAMSRKVMLMRITNPGIRFSQMAIELAVHEADLKMFEFEGKNRCASALIRLSIDETVERVVKENSKIITDVKNANLIGKSNPLMGG